MPKRTARKSAKRKAAKKPAAKKPTAKKGGSPKQAAPKKAGATKARGGDGRLAHLQQLIELMVDKDVVEVELEEAGTRWRVRRTEPHAVAYAAAPSVPLPHASAPGASSAQTADAESIAADKEPEGEVYTSPMLGTFYRAPSPDSEPFVKAGDKVSADTTLCIIEAMKVMNEIKAEREFEILDILVKNGDPVEFGQPLFLIR